MAFHDLRPGGIALTKHALQFCSFKAQAVLIDVGCGNGQTRSYLRHKGLNTYGIDIHKDITSKDIQAHAMALPLRSQSVDGILAECVLSLMPHKVKALKEWARVCQDNAYLILHDVYTKRTPCTQEEKEQTLHPTTLCTNLENSGWQLVHSEDCSQHIKAYAAQMLWHGKAESTCPLFYLPQLGYALWIAQKKPCSYENIHASTPSRNSTQYS